jgi:Ca-activated chloride channel family protein
MSELWLERPTALALLALLPLFLLLQAYVLARQRRSLERFSGLSAALVTSSARRRATRLVLKLLALACLVLALAGPRLGRVSEQRDVVVALDASQSMAVQDVSPNRLAVARRVVDRLASELQGQRLGLVFFAGKGLARFPLTTDTEVIGQVLDHSGRPFSPPDGSSLEAALETGLSLFHTPRDSSRPTSIVLLSDGEDPSDSLSILPKLRENNVRVFAIGVGTESGGEVPIYDLAGKFTFMLSRPDVGRVHSRLNEAPLQQLADSTGGRFWSYTGLEPVPDELVAEILRQPATEVLGGRAQVDDRPQLLLLALAIVLLVLEAWIPERQQFPLPGAG